MPLIKNKVEKLREKQEALKIQANQIDYFKETETFRIYLTDEQAWFINSNLGYLKRESRDSAYTKIWNGYAPFPSYPANAYDRLQSKDEIVQFVKDQFTNVENGQKGHDIKEAHHMTKKVLYYHLGLDMTDEAHKKMEPILEKGLELKQAEEKAQAEAREKSRLETQRILQEMKQKEADSVAIYSNFMNKEDTWEKGETNESAAIARVGLSEWWDTTKHTKTISNKTCVVEVERTRSHVSNENGDVDENSKKEVFNVKIKVEDKVIYSGSKESIEQKSLSYQKQKEASKQALALTIPAPIESDSETLK